MDDKYKFIDFLGLRFNVANDLSVLVSAVLVFILVFALSRKVTMRPGKAQNVLEWMIDFTNGIVKSAMPDGSGKQFNLYAFVLFLFIFVSNQLGLFFQLKIDGFTYVKSPTSNPLITMGLATVSLLLSHYYAVKKFGFGGYLSHYLWFIFHVKWNKNNIYWRIFNYEGYCGSSCSWYRCSWSINR